MDSQDPSCQAFHDTQVDPIASTDPQKVARTILTSHLVKHTRTRPMRSGISWRRSFPFRNRPPLLESALRSMSICNEGTAVVAKIWRWCRQQDLARERDGTMETYLRRQQHAPATSRDLDNLGRPGRNR